MSSKRLKKKKASGGDLNAKTKYPNFQPTHNQLPHYSKILGRFAKSTLNKNGELLIEFADMHNLKITNIFFKHRPVHCTTWKCSEKRGKILDSRT